MEVRVTHIAPVNAEQSHRLRLTLNPDYRWKRYRMWFINLKD